jgi:hypothetical protein
VQDYIWVTREGEHIPVGRMETRHIKNCIAMIYRRYPWRKQYLVRMEFEVHLREHGEWPKA